MPIAFIPEGNAPIEYVFVADQPFRRVLLDETFVPNAELLHIYAEVYRDPSNMDPASDLEFRYEQDELWVRGDGAEEPIRQLDNVSFPSSLGLIELSFRRMEKYQRLYWVRPRVITV